MVGFYISGTGEKTLLIRGIGPKLADYEVPSVVADPMIAVYHDQDIVDGNEDWDASLATTFLQMGAFALDPGSTDAAMTITLPSGGHTVHATGKGAAGIAIIEIYESP